jgi:hypothetical protein
VLFWTEGWECFLLQFLVDCATLVVRRTEDTADITGAIFSMTLVSEMITGALDASRFEMNIKISA